MKNLDEFLEKTKPGAKKSRLHDFLPELKSLREKNYTLNQLKEFLLTNGVVISIPWLSAFLRAHGELPKQNHATKPVSVSPEPSIETPPVKTGFHEVLEQIAAKNSSEDPRRN